MCNSWVNALGMYDWSVDLRRFGSAADYPGYFNRVITPADTVAFENTFRTAINEAGSFEIAGEVCFWKNYGNALGRDRVTQRLLSYLAEPVNWDSFVQAVTEVSANPSYNNFVALQSACNQPRGFATPITFLAFYRPTKYPMVDKHIAFWWGECRANHGFGDSPDFFQRHDGWIQSDTVARRIQNWNAYIAWKIFCCDYAARMAINCRLNWRVRDIEMAVWEAQKNGMPSNVLPQI